MSREATFDEVRISAAAFGDRATLITVSDAGTPHVVTSLVRPGADEFLVEVGGRTRAHLVERPALTMVWHPAGGGEYQLLVDAVATSIGEPDARGVSPVSVAVERGILHRLAGLSTQGPTCRALG